jgi:general stress protein 26
MNDNNLKLMSVEKLKERIEDIEICMFSTVEPSGKILSRPMSTRKMDPDGTLWFFTNELSEKVDDVEIYDNVNLAYANVSKQSYVSISGSAEIVKDQMVIDKLWSPILKAWFPRGLEDPNLALIKVIPHSAEYWNASSNKMEQMMNVAKAIMKGKQYESGEHGQINLR